MDEEKTIDEAVKEQADEMKEFEPVAFDEVIKETDPERKDAPILRDAPEPADMNMIHKHLDNFLAMLCGETPIDDNVRNSTEYWLKRLVDGLGGSTKKIYLHQITTYKANPYRRIAFFILNNDKTKFTFSMVADYLKNKAIEKQSDFELLSSGGGVFDSDSVCSASIGYLYNSNQWYISGLNATDGADMVKYYAQSTSFTNELGSTMTDVVVPAN